jgi:hypothetical protein
MTKLGRRGVIYGRGTRGTRALFLIKNFLIETPGNITHPPPFFVKQVKT